MKLSMGSLLIAIATCLSVYAQDTITDKGSEAVFPSAVSFNAQGKDYELDATGTATRKKFFVKLYGVAHYLQNGSSGDKFQAVMDPTKAKQLTLKWVRDVPGDKMREGYYESFNKALTPSEGAQLKSQIDQYVSFFNDGVKKGGEQIIRWIPGGIIEVVLNGKPAGTITNEGFAKAVWQIWFGDHSVLGQDGRDGLVSLMR